MDKLLLSLEITTITVAWWLGFYVLARDRHNRQLTFTGLGLLAYGLALVFFMVSGFAPGPESNQVLGRWGWPFLFLPALFWAGTLVYLLPESSPLRSRLVPILNRGLVPFAIVIYLLAVRSQVFKTNLAGEIVKGPAYTVFAGLVALLLFSILTLLLWVIHGQSLHSPVGLITLATLFFGLGVGLLLIPLDLLPEWLLILGIGMDLVLLGVGIALSDAFEKGEAFLPDILRSLAYSLFFIILFGGQVVLAMAWSTGITLPMLILLLAVIMTAIVIQTFVDPLQEMLDWLLFSRIPRIREIRSDARIISSGASRTREVVDPTTFSDDQFARLTRRALSNMGNLPRLSASPLTRMDLIESRLANRGAADNTLERAAELKIILAESIDRLKPPDGKIAGTTGAWRHYNAVYYPYVLGLKPYSRRVEHHEQDQATQAVLEWFRMQVPERTLYNWQNAAAKLIAQDIRELAENPIYDS